MARVIYFASSYGVGLTALLVEKALALHELRDMKFLFISGEREQFPGLFEKLRTQQIRHIPIPGLDEHAKFLRLVRAFSREAGEFKPDIVHVQTNWQLAIVAAARRFSRRRYLIVYTIHGYRNNRRFRSVPARFMIGAGLKMWADWVFVPSSFLNRRFAFLARKSSLLFLGVEDLYFDRGGPVSFEGPVRIVFPAEFRRGKNHERLIRTVARVIDRIGGDRVHLYLPGRGELLQTCQAICQRSGLEGAVSFPGFLDRKALLNLFMTCQFVVVPASVETFSQVIAEGLVLGRVVVSRRVGVAEDVIVHGETGCLYDSDEELEALLCSLADDRVTCQQISQNALSVREVFRWRNICEQYARILTGIGGTTQPRMNGAFGA